MKESSFKLKMGFLVILTVMGCLEPKLFVFKNYLEYLTFDLKFYLNLINILISYNQI